MTSSQPVSSANWWFTSFPLALPIASLISLSNVVLIHIDNLDKLTTYYTAIHSPYAHVSIRYAARKQLYYC